MSKTHNKTTNSEDGLDKIIGEMEKRMNKIIKFKNDLFEIFIREYSLKHFITSQQVRQYLAKKDYSQRNFVDGKYVSKNVFAIVEKTHVRDELISFEIIIKDDNVEMNVGGTFLEHKREYPSTMFVLDIVKMKPKN